MLIRTIIFSLLLTISFSGFAQYNADKIQLTLAVQEKTFDILNWSKEGSPPSWKAKSKIKRQYLTISKSKADLILPFLNPREKQRGIVLCELFISIAINAENEIQISTIKELIRKSTTRHIIRTANMNEMQFTIAPTIKKNVVSLHCSVSSKD